MRRFLTGYAISYNRRHNRHGYLFQNRYKSIVCEEDTYFRELVRYIHLNPLRAGLVKSIEELDEYPWSGHAILLGIISYRWQDTDYVLGWFGEKVGEAKLDYHEYIEDGISKGRRPELVGGGLLRSNRSGSEVKAIPHNRVKIRIILTILLFFYIVIYINIGFSDVLNVFYEKLMDLDLQKKIKDYFFPSYKR